jgi:hypothetical protein
MLLPLAVRAQSPSPAPSATPSVSAPATGAASDANSDQSANQRGAQRRDAMKARMAALTPEERERVKSAREKAMQDPAVKAAEAEKSTDPRAFHKAVHEAMLRADPTIGPILEKLRPAGGHRGAAAASE